MRRETWEGVCTKKCCESESQLVTSDWLTKWRAVFETISTPRFQGPLSDHSVQQCETKPSAITFDT